MGPEYNPFNPVQEPGTFSGGNTSANNSLAWASFGLDAFNSLSGFVTNITSLFDGNENTNPQQTNNTPNSQPNTTPTPNTPAGGVSSTTIVLGVVLLVLIIIVLFLVLKTSTQKA